MNLSPEEKRALSNLYSDVQKNLEIAHSSKDWKKATNSNILLVDGNNTFMRAWCAINAMTDNGDHSGGVVGFLKSVGLALKTYCPSRCIVAFDGVGGSYKRRKIFPDYKGKRKNKIRLNRTYDDHVSLSDEEKSCIRQFARLHSYLDILPVNVVVLDHVEADDTIAYCALDTFKESNVIVMSADKDFLQLVSERVKIWSPTKKILYGPAEVIRDYGIHPDNFVLYRIMDGDESDGIDGIKGAGLKTILKCFPFLTESNKYSVDSLIEYAQNSKKRYKLYDTVLENKDILYRNFELMQLKDSLLTTTTQLKVNEELDTANIPHMDRNVFARLLVEDSMLNNFPNHQTWLMECFGSMDLVTRKE